MLKTKLRRKNNSSHRIETKMKIQTRQTTFRIKFDYGMDSVLPFSKILIPKHKV